MIKEGSAAPDFELDGSDGKTHALKEFGGKYLVLYFYPKDDTPGCTIEAKEFTEHAGEIRALGGEVVGVSKDDYDSHCKFMEKHKLNILLLSDPENKTISAYDAYGNRGIFGEGTLRKTYVIGRDGKVLKDFGKVSPQGHAKAVVEFLNGIKG